MQERWFQSLGWEDLLEEGVATHSSILAWRIPWMEKPGRLCSIGWQRVGHNWSNLVCTHAYTHTHTHTHIHVYIGKGNVYTLQYSYLENFMDSGAWWAIHGHQELDTTERLTHTHTHIFIYMYTHIYIYIYMYIWITLLFTWSYHNSEK